MTKEILTKARDLTEIQIQAIYLILQKDNLDIITTVPRERLLLSSLRLDAMYIISNMDTDIEDSVSSLITDALSNLAEDYEECQGIGVYTEYDGIYTTDEVNHFTTALIEYILTTSYEAYEEANPGSGIPTINP